MGTLAECQLYESSPFAVRPLRHVHSGDATPHRVGNRREGSWKVGANALKDPVVVQ